MRAVFLLLDIDTFGDPAATNRYIETLLPQALSGESGVYFWWRNLTALQVRSWQRILREARAAIEERDRQAPSVIGKVKLALVRLAALSGLAARGSQAGSDYNRPFGQRAHFAEQLQLLQRIAALSRQNGAELIVAVSPLHRAVESRYLPKDLSQALDQVARVTPLWDFTGADWLSDDPNYWMGDTAHYSSGGRPHDARPHFRRPHGARLGAVRPLEGRLRACTKRRAVPALPWATGTVLCRRTGCAFGTRARTITLTARRTRFSLAGTCFRRAAIDDGD